MIGRIVGDKYELVQELGTDAIFDTFRAVDRGRNRSVKIRLIRPQVAQESAFIQDLQEVVDQHHTHFQHPSLERVFEMREDDGIWFIASEFEEGSILEERLKRLSSFSVPVAVGLAISIAEALEACHASGLIHGDVSARTVFSKQGEGVKLMQAGFWQAYRFSETAARQMVPAMAPHLAPEITSGSMPGKASDIYSLGVLLYRLLTGRYPFMGDSPQSFAEQHMTAPYPSLKRSLASVPPALDEIVKKCLAKRPDERYANATELLTDLRLLQDALRFGRSLKWPLAESSQDDSTVPVAPAIDDPEKPAKPVRKRERNQNDGLPLWLSIIGYLSTFLLLAAVGFWVFYNSNTNREVEVPNIVGKTFIEASEELKGLNLKLRKRSEQVSDEPEGTILETNPTATRMARENSFVDATVSAGARFVELPDLKGRKVDVAKNMLTELKLKFETRDGRDRNAEKDEVLEQSPSPKAKVERGSTVTLTINSGTSSPPVSQRTLYTYKLDVEMPTGSVPIKVRIDMTDGAGTEKVHEDEHMPGEVFQVKADGQGSEATFRIYFDDILVEELTKQAESREEPNAP